MELQSANPKLHIHEKELILPVSGQELVSDKSLHRHMKDNSDGNQGGTGDPIPEEESRVQEMKQQDHEDYGDVDSDLFSRGWSTTGKRMRNSRARVNIPGFSQDEEASRHGDEAGQPGKQKLPLKKRKMMESPGSTSGNGHSSLSGSRIMEPGESENDDLTDPGEETAVPSINSDNNLTERLNEHVCNICNRSFKSYQALGGHKAHHNNDKAEDISFTEEKNGSTRKPRKSNKVHQCELCNKIFSQGQALGGHKRHCKGQAIHGGGLETEKKPRVLDFDLNELPPEWISEE